MIAPGPNGKRWDTHPRCTRDRFLAAEQVWLHMEGTLKLDALVSAGEVGADVPSVTLWDRAGAVSWADWPRGRARRAAGRRILGVVRRVGGCLGCRERGSSQRAS